MEPYLFADTISYIKSRPALIGLLKWLNLIIVTISIGSYVLLAIWALFLSDADERMLMIKMVFPIPAIGFIMLSMFRKFVNSPRPYEVYDFSPVINKKTTGKSFPSRHVFSIYMISTLYLVIAFRIESFSYIPGIVLFVLGDFLGVIRMITGVHFFKDVIVGALVGIIFGLLILFIH